MSTITIFWFSKKDKTYKQFPLNKIFLFLLFSIILILLISSCFFSYLSFEIQGQFSQLSLDKQRLQELNKNQDIKIQKLEERLSAKTDKIEHLNQRCVYFEQQFDKIKKMELKIRHYLGLQFDNKDIENHSHQGGFEQIAPDIVNYENHNASSYLKSYVNWSSNALAVTKGLEQISNYLLKKKRILDTIPSILPVVGEEVWLSSDYGWRINPFTSKKEFHSAIDIAGRLKTPIISPAKGEVTETGRNNIWGKYIRIKHGQGLTTAYGHLHSFNVTEGQKVKRRDVVGYMGNTGHSTGTHVHYKVLRHDDSVDPKEFVLDRNFNSLSLKERYEKEEQDS